MNKAPFCGYCVKVIQKDHLCITHELFKQQYEKEKLVNQENLKTLEKGYEELKVIMFDNEEELNYKMKMITVLSERIKRYETKLEAVTEERDECIERYRVEKRKREEEDKGRQSKIRKVTLSIDDMTIQFPLNQASLDAITPTIFNGTLEPLSQ